VPCACPGGEEAKSQMTRDGILNLDKPRGPTSHDVVARIRRLTGVRRVGHAGTLDPLATGVLLICIGRATRVSEYLMTGRKVYRARARLGVTTDTYDAEGQVVAEAEVEASRAQVEAALAQFRGQIAQVPPMYSAIKHQGTSLHRLARQGIEVEREPRPVEIFRLELTAWEPPECTLEMTCSRGTYVRSLVHDLGQTLGCGAYLTGLIRLASGDFADSARRLCQGQAIANSEWQGGGLVRVYGPDGAFLALAAYDAEAGLWRPRKVFRQFE